MPHGSGEQRLSKREHRPVPMRNLEKLKAKQVKKVDDPGDHADRGNFQGFPRDYNSYEPIAGRVIFDQAAFEGRLDCKPSQREIRRSFEGGVFALVRWQFAERFARARSHARPLFL